MTLAELVAARLERAGITWDDPGLVQIREHNRLAVERASNLARIAELRAELDKRH